jgi:hypothetical protein
MRKERELKLPDFSAVALVLLFFVLVVDPAPSHAEGWHIHFNSDSRVFS